MSAATGPAFGLVAGEASGDNLGGPLIGALAERAPGSRFFGIAGPRMAEAGCEAWFSADELAVMGLAEIVRHLPRADHQRRPHGAAWRNEYLYSRAATIYGGTAEVQRNIIARRLLHLGATD